VRRHVFRGVTAGFIPAELPRTVDRINPETASKLRSSRTGYGAILSIVAVDGCHDD